MLGLQKSPSDAADSASSILVWSLSMYQSLSICISSYLWSFDSSYSKWSPAGSQPEPACGTAASWRDRQVLHLALNLPLATLTMAVRCRWPCDMETSACSSSRLGCTCLNHHWFTIYWDRMTYWLANVIWYLTEYSDYSMIKYALVLLSLGQILLVGPRCRGSSTEILLLCCLQMGEKLRFWKSWCRQHRLPMGLEISVQRNGIVLATSDESSCWVSLSGAGVHAAIF